MLSAQAALHDAFEPCHELVRAERAPDRFRGPQARQRFRLRLRIDEGGDAAEPIEQWRNRHEAVIASVKMRAQARPCPVLRPLHQPRPYRVARIMRDAEARKDFGSKDCRRLAAMTPPRSRETLQRELSNIKTEIAP